MSSTLPDEHGPVLALHQPSPTTPPPELPAGDTKESDTSLGMKTEAQRSSPDLARISDSNNGCSDPHEQLKALPLDESKRVQSEVQMFSTRPLPPTPCSSVSSSYEAKGPNIQQAQNNTSPVMLSNEQPLTPDTNESIDLASVASKLDNTQHRLSSLDPELYTDDNDSTMLPRPLNLHKTAKQLPCAVRLRDGNMLTISPPERTAWKRTAYIPGPARLQKHSIEEEPLSPLELARFSFHIDFAPQPFDLFGNRLDDAFTTTSTKKSEDTSMNDIIDFINTYNFEPTSFPGDQFWLDPETKARNRAAAATRAALPTDHPPTSPYRLSNSPGSPLLTQTSIRRLSSSTWTPPRSRRTSSTYQDPYQPNLTGRSSWNSSPLTARSSSGSATTKRVSALTSPLAGRRYSGKRGSSSAGSAGKENKIGFMRLLKGAGSIV